MKERKQNHACVTNIQTAGTGLQKEKKKAGIGGNAKLKDCIGNKNKFVF